MRKLLYAIAVLLLMSLSSETYAAPIKFGYLANRGHDKAKEQWTDLVDKLSKETGLDIRLVPLPMEKAIETFGNKEVDLLLSNSVMSAIVMEKYKGKLLATQNGKDGYEFGGVIIANKNSGITKSEDIKGKKVMSYGKDSAGAYIFQVYHLKQKGIDVEKDTASFTQAQKQDNIAIAVKAGIADVGFLRTGFLEAMEKEGKVKMDDFIIVDKVNDNFGSVHSTALYPEWGLVVRADLDQEIADKIKSAVLSLKADDPVVKKADIRGFVEPRDMEPLIKVLKELKVPPFDK